MKIAKHGLSPSTLPDVILVGDLGDSSSILCTNMERLVYTIGARSRAIATSRDASDAAGFFDRRN